MANPYAFVGRIVNPVSLDNLEYIENGVIIVADGKIAAFEDTLDNLDNLLKTFQVKEEDVTRLSGSQWVMPGLVDTHIHGPQYPNAGLGYDMELLDWLQTYTFPLEARFSDVEFASKVYEAVVRRTLSSGTTTASYYATIHKDTALVLAQKAISLNQRAFVGKVNMNMDVPENLLESLEGTLADTQEFIDNFPSSELVKPVITPRFALSCDMAAMKGLAEIARERDIHIQTHVSENPSEIERCAYLYPDCSSYAGVYGEAGLLTEKTILAHGVYLSYHDLAYVKKKGTSVAHCPNSNLSLGSGLCPVRTLLNAGLKVGLGTDCSGGYSVSIIDAMRCAFSTSVAVSFTKPDLKPLAVSELVFLATLGGADALGLGGITGNFSTGKCFDALLIDIASNPEEDLLEDYTLQQLVQKFIYRGDDRNVAQVYVNGALSLDKKIKS